MGKEALVIERKILFTEGEFQGFLPLEKMDFISIILDKSNYFYHSRGDDLENNRALKQIIPYVWIVNPETKNVFLYKRSLSDKKKGEYNEIRYLNKYSGGVGGHIDKDTEENANNPIMEAMMRELKEEVIMDHYPKPEIIGCTNDDSDSLGTVHFGIVAVVKTNKDVKAQKSEGLSSGAFYSIKRLEEIFTNPKNNIENWTRISWPFVKAYLEKIN